MRAGRSTPRTFGDTSDVAAAEAARAAVAEALFSIKLDAVPERGVTNDGSSGGEPSGGEPSGNLREPSKTRKDARNFEGDALAGDFGSDARRRGGVTLVQEGDARVHASRDARRGVARGGARGHPWLPSCDSIPTSANFARLVWRSTAIPGADRLHMPEELRDGRRPVRRAEDVSGDVRTLSGRAASGVGTSRVDERRGGLFPRRRRRPRRGTSTPTTLGTVDPRTHASIYAAARDDLPCARRAYHAPEDALVTVMHAGPHEETTTSALNRALTWSEYHDEYRAALARRREAERLARLAEQEARAIGGGGGDARLAAEGEPRRALPDGADARARRRTRRRARAGDDRRGGGATTRRGGRRRERDAAQEEAADWAWDGSDATELEAERLAEEEAANAPDRRSCPPATATRGGVDHRVRRRDRAKATCRTARRSRSDRDGAPTVAFDGTRVGLRGASVVATFGNDSARLVRRLRAFSG